MKIIQNLLSNGIVLIMCCMFCCGCDRDIPINERPMYGNVPPTPEVEKANKEFIKMIETRGDKEDGARKMVEVAWYYYGKNNLAVAMKRFNQAWLLNSNNPEIYLGFACIAAKK